MTRKQKSLAPKTKFNNEFELCAPNKGDQQHLEQETTIRIATTTSKS